MSFAASDLVNDGQGAPWQESNLRHAVQEVP